MVAMCMKIVANLVVIHFLKQSHSESYALFTE